MLNFLPMGACLSLTRMIERALNALRTNGVRDIGDCLDKNTGVALDKR